MGACLLGSCVSRVVDTCAVFREGMLASRAGAFLQFWTTLPEAADHQGARGLQQSRIEVSTASAHQHCLHRPLPTKVDDLRTSRSRPAAGEAVTKQ